MKDDKLKDLLQGWEKNLNAELVEACFYLKFSSSPGLPIFSCLFRIALSVNPVRQIFYHNLSAPGLCCLRCHERE